MAFSGEEGPNAPYYLVPFQRSFSFCVERGDFHPWSAGFDGWPWGSPGLCENHSWWSCDRGWDAFPPLTRQNRRRL